VDPSARLGLPWNEATLSIRVLIADDEPPLLRMVAELIRAHEGFEVTALAADADEAADRAGETLPDVALLDVRMPGGGVSAARAIRSRSPHTHIVAHSAYHDTTLVLAMLRAGAIGYVVKGAPPRELIAALEGAARGTTTLSGEAISGMVAELSGQRRESKRTAAERGRLRREIRGVIDRTTLTSALQPIFDLERLEPVGYEALARFPNHSTRQVPDWFTDAATVGLRAELELAAVATGMSALGSLPANTFLAVNASPELLGQRTLTEMLLSAAPTRRVVLELTEHAEVADYEALVGNLHDLRASGCRIAVDDAGAGYASLRHILRLRPDYIKLDMTLTRGIDRDGDRRALASSLLTFARELSATVIAEGIETEAELDTLRGLGATLGQGYYLARPSEAAALFPA
jgi:EAL domain-containing protein (putative c-di-GMP-specific phosphodiesterase class I)/DNA-binding NarL/FixJ family response regulator